jgi:hypothetical protein
MAALATNTSISQGFYKPEENIFVRDLPAKLKYTVN